MQFLLLVFNAPVFPDNPMFRTRGRTVQLSRSSLLWAAQKTEKKLSCTATSPSSPSTPLPMLLLLSSWPSCAPGAAFISSFCSTSGPILTLWTLLGPRVCLKRGCLLPARGWTAWAWHLCTPWPCSPLKPSSSNCFRLEATRRAVDQSAVLSKSGACEQFLK